MHRHVVRLAPLSAFLNNPDRRPVYGDDPASVDSERVFSVAPIRRRVLTRDLHPSLHLIAVAATLDLVANVFYLLANRRGALSIVAVLSSLYPASTIVLANRVLGERIARTQAVGMGLAGLAVGLVALG